jgi:phosphate transport system substrate-binding protein
MLPANLRLTPQPIQALPAKGLLKPFLRSIVWVFGVPVALGALHAAIAGTTSPDDLHGKLIIAGSSTVAPLVAEIGKRFEQSHPAVRVDVQSGGSSRGITDARNGLSDIGMISRALNNDESDLQSFPLAHDGICMILNSVNPVTALTDSQIIEIYTGKITNWKELSGRDAPITVVNKAEGRSTLELFLQYFKLKSTDIKPHVVIGENQEAIKTVSGNPNSIAYVSIGSAEYESTHGTPIKLLPLQGVSASVETVRDGTFPLSRTLNLIVHGQPTNLAIVFIQFAQSERVHDLILEQYFVPCSK